MFIRRKTFQDLKEQLNTLLSTLKKAEDRAVLVSIERRSKVNIFTFSRNGKVFQIETMGLLGDNVEQWKRDLL